MATLNQCQFIGRLGKDPEVRVVAGGKKTAKFSIACSEKFKDQNGEVKEKTEWINCVVWDKLADVVEKYVKKGSQIYVSGKLQNRSWADPQSGQKRFATDIVIRELQMLDSKPQNNSAGYNAGAQAGAQAQANQAGGFDGGGFADDGDLPF